VRDEELDEPIHVRRVRALRHQDRTEPELGLEVLDGVPVRLDRVDLAVVAERPEGLGEVPVREGVRRIAAVEDGDPGAELGALEVGVEAPELFAGRERLVDEGVRRERGDVDVAHVVLELGLDAVERLPEVLARDVAFADQHLPDVAARAERLGAERVRVDRHVSPPERREAGAPELGVDLAVPVRHVRRLAERKEEDADGEVVPLRQPAVRRDEPLEERAIGREQEPGAVAGVLDRAAAMLQAREAAERELDRLARRLAAHLGHGADPATAATRV
jgi:hypothetical protein